MNMTDYGFDIMASLSDILPYSFELAEENRNRTLTFHAGEGKEDRSVNILVTKMDKLSSLWTELQKSNKLPRSSLTSSCQDELQELMKQLDIMVNSKKQDWQRQLEQVQSRLDMKEKELRLQKATADQKSKEAEELRSQLEGGNKTQKEIVTEYEEQLAKLRSEVQKMKREYDKLHRRHSKQTKEIERHKDMLVSEQDNSFELKRLQEKNEELHHKNKDLEMERRNLNKQVETLEVKNKGLSEKCDFIQQQSETYQSQLDRRRQMQDNTELNLKSKIAQLESQLHRYKTVLTVQKEKIEKLKSALDEALNSHKRGMSDNEKLLEELRRANVTIRRLEGENNEMVSEVQSKTDLLRVTEEDTSQYAKDVARLEQTIGAKDEIIRNIGKSNRNAESEQVALLKQSYADAKEEIRSYKKLEKKIRFELSNVEDKYQQLVLNNEEISTQLQQREEELEYLKQTEIHKLTDEISRLQEHANSVEGNHKAELSGMRLRLSKLTTELHQRDVTMAALSEKTSDMEKQLRGETEIGEKKVVELQKENGQLKEDVSTLKNEISEIEQKLTKRLTNRNTSIILERIKSSVIGDTMVDNSKIFSDINGDQQDYTTEQYDVQLQLLYDQKQRLEEELHIQKRENMRLMNEVSKHSGRDRVDASFLTVADTVDMSLCSKSDFGDLVSRLLTEDQAEKIAERFLEEEKERTIALEELIDSHIEKFRLGTEDTLKKYNYVSS
ncbi:centrosomal protein of 63 kDa isoform X3 [Patella vulgata]|uniref:centrosomal protein of 63 kDa isoform X3 n=1 Tax=Patella vulgata TaxID=6465 RepID=UPI002180428F|nr:centrosomal protein of 63 kDa isoform X3 [Patella vulgata]